MGAFSHRSLFYWSVLDKSKDVSYSYINTMLELLTSLDRVNAVGIQLM